MKIFISWSGTRSKAVADALRDWLPTIVQSLEPFVSTQDIPSGSRGLNALASELEACSFGLICLTQENKLQPWINYEAGALSKAIEASRVVPLLLDLKISDITGPLAQFQAVNASNKEDLFGLVRDLAEASGPHHVSNDRLRRIFDAFWPDLETKIASISATSNDQHGGQSSRSDRDVLEELLILSRRTERELTRAANRRVADQVLASRSSRNREYTPSWREHLTRVVVGEILKRIKHRGANIKSYTMDDDALHVIIDGAAPEDEDFLCREFQAVVQKYLVPIHVRGEPIGDATFGIIG